MMPQTTMVVAINRPIAQVFAFVANAELAPQWQEEMVEVQRTTAGLIGVGTLYRAVRGSLREQVAALLEIVEYEPYTAVAFERSEGPLRVRDSYVFASVGVSTRVAYSFDLGTRPRGSRHLLSGEARALSALKGELEALGRGARPVRLNSAPVPAALS